MQALHKLLLLHVLTYLGRNALGAKIINGVKVPKDSMLFMASLQTTDGHMCGGSLISDNFVLTAAHCDGDNDDNVPVRVVFGTHDLRKNGTVRHIEQRCKHPDYQDDTLENDIMLLKLSQSVPVGGTIQHIRLPPPNMNLKHNQLCHVAGWGVTEAGRDTDDLRVALVSVVDQNVCRQQWSNVGLNLDDNVICAGGYKTNNGNCNVSFLSVFGKFMSTIQPFLFQNIKIFPFYRVILVVLWCTTRWLLVLYLSEIHFVGTDAYLMSIQTCPSSVPGSTRLSCKMVVNYNNCTQSIASAYLHCI
uniref:trypsin n=1 Tax=Sparus aurata TaxID=8175 RepID=A0A671UG46_SPAAU